MFANLSQKLLTIFSNIRNKGVLSESIIDETIREIRVSLIEADVALSVVKEFTNELRLKLKDQKIIKSVTPEQLIIKIVYDELVNLLGGSNSITSNNITNNNTANINVTYNKKSIMLVGLQGTGKTTTAAKLANFIKTKYKHNCLLVSLDTYRPAAIEQLRQLAHKNQIDFFEISDTNPILIAQKAKLENYHTIIYDTAGRSYIDNNMMDKLKQIENTVYPDETLLVIDSMMGQDAFKTAKTFNECVKLTGLILTRVDGDSRGGAALSAKYVTGCQIKFIGTGEKINDFEIFHPDRIASRILDKGDIVSLVEKAMDENVAKEISDVKIGKDFDLNGMAKYLQQISKIGGMSGLMKFLPGIKQIQQQLQNNSISEKTITRQIAIIQSMTPKERHNPKLLDASRRKRIANGCGQSVADVNKLVKQFEQIKDIMIRFSSFGLFNKFIK